MIRVFFRGRTDIGWEEISEPCCEWDRTNYDIGDAVVLVQNGQGLA